VRLTKQKQKLQNTLQVMEIFFNAEELHKKVPKIGIATIYRFLTSAVKNGELHAYQCERKTVYSMSKKNHSHFICEKCGKITHLNLKKLGFIDKQIKGKICHIQIDITGFCKNCNE